VFDIDIDWSGQDGEFSPYFGSGGNYICDPDDAPECITSSPYFESTLDQFYYVAILDAPHGCCTEESACTYNENSTVDTGCEYPGDPGTEYEFTCDCDGNVEDCAGDCGGVSFEDCFGICDGDADTDCAGVCEGDAIYDDCDVCGGDNSTCDVNLSFGEIDGNAGTVELYIVNNVDVYGFQLDIYPEGDPLYIIDVCGGSAEESSFSISWGEQGDGAVIIIGFSLIGSYIPVGEGVLLYVDFVVGEDIPGNLALCFDYAIFATEDGDELSVSVGECVTVPGECEYYGEINGDGVVNILDIVVLVNYVLTDDTTNPCSDLNEDGLVVSSVRT
jgi:hypothetical protein